MPRRYLSEVEVARIVALAEEGVSYREIARRLGVSDSVIRRALSRLQETGNMTRREGQGPRRITTDREDRTLIRSAIRSRTATAPAIANQLQGNVGVRVSGQTVRRRLREGNLLSRRPVRVPALNANHRRGRLAYAREHLVWDRQLWSRVLFSDESRFGLHMNDGRVRVWRRPGEQFREDCLAPNVAFNGGSVMVWGGISWNNRTELVIIPPPGLNANRYVAEVLGPHVVPQRLAQGPGFMFMHDNARPHTARFTQNFLRGHNITVLNHPSMSPDLNPIEHVWDVLNRAVRGRNLQPATLEELRVMLVQVWNEIPQEAIQRCINMTERLQAVIRSRGGNTRF